MQQRLGRQVALAQLEKRRDPERGYEPMLDEPMFDAPQAEEPSFDEEP